jgi:RNA polymerase sigma-70 factor (ECF subfamily)
MAYAADTHLAGLTQPRETLELEDFTSLVMRYRPAVFRFLLFSLRDRDAAETLTQECFLKAYSARQSFRGDSKVRTWLMRIALNLSRDHTRNRRLQFWRNTQAASAGFSDLSESVADRGGSQEAVLLAKEQVQAVWTVADSLSERQRAVFLLRFVEDLDLLEIAEVTGLKEGTVKAHLFRAIDAIRKRLKEAS